ncbi:MAG: glycerophosphodiester phosphodiesterase family protein [bacterium]
MLIIGHRGAMGSEPENTLRSFKKAVELGADGVELDVYLSRDKELVVIHNNYVGLTTNSHGLIERMTLAEIKKLDAGRGEQVPTLEEVIDSLVPKNFIINIELKGVGTVVPTVELVEQKKITDRVIISSFLHSQVKIVKRLNPQIKTALLARKLPLRIAKFLRLAKIYKADGFHIRKNFLRKRHLKAAQENGLYVWVWTANGPREIKKFKNWGVDGIITNYPDRALK